ncbi:MAG: flavin reductase [Marmoricola sp.]|nr:flavin reductase [Marmoricola sp.]
MATDDGVEGSYDESVTPARMREAMGRLPTGVCVVTTTTEGEDVGLTVGSVVSVSLEPPLVLVCVGRSVRLHDALVGSGSWGVSVLAENAGAVSSLFARQGSDTRGRVAQVAHHRGAVTGVALVDDACAWLECRTEAVHPAGDHSILVGRVVSTAVAPDAPDGARRAPLVHHRGGYGTVRTSS